MGREIKRVPLDFDAPINEPWAGYQPPRWRSCPSPDCSNGQTRTGAWVHAIIYPLLMLDRPLASERDLHPWLAELPLRPSGLPTSDAVEFCTALAGRAGNSPFGHDAIDQWRSVEALLRGAGLSKDFFRCKVCDGHAIHPDDLAASEAWERTEPPAGDGWQLWQTVSDGPISPVFATSDGLVAYLATTGDAWGHVWRREAAEAFMREGWAPSFVGIGGRLLMGGEDADRIEATR